jgi:uncharacterized protein YqgV (UPF0045/DUF77 family)
MVRHEKQRSTFMEGEWDEVMALVKPCHER